MSTKFRARRIEQGLCADCPKATAKKATRGWRCDECAEANARHSRARQARLRQARREAAARFFAVHQLPTARLAEVSASSSWWVPSVLPKTRVA